MFFAHDNEQIIHNLPGKGMLKQYAIPLAFLLLVLINGDV
jgi:hypothetical protein